MPHDLKFTERGLKTLGEAAFETQVYYINRRDSEKAKLVEASLWEAIILHKSRVVIFLNR